MTRRLGTFITIALAAAAISLLVSRPIANAHGIVDQAWEGPASCQETKSSTIQIQNMLGMEVTPSQPTIVSVDVSLIQANEAGDATITVRLRDATISGTVLSSVSQLVPEAISRDAMEPSFVHFDFPSVVSVVLGQMYVIELASSNVTHAVNGCEGPGEDGEYLGGDSIVGLQHHDVDFLFRTYSEGQPASATATGIAIPPAATRTPVARPPSQQAPTQLPGLPPVGQGDFGKPDRGGWLIALTAAAALALASAAWYTRRRMWHR